MKVGWKILSLSDLISVQSGFAFKSAEYSDEGHFLMRIGNVQDGYVTSDNPKFVCLNKRTTPFALSEGDILTSLTGNIGRVGKVETKHLPAALNQRVARITVKRTELILPEYLYHFLSSQLFRDHLVGAGHGAAQQNVSPKEIGAISLPLPPLDEQRRIVAVLDKAFAGIATATANAQKNLTNARTLFDSALERELQKSGSSVPSTTIGSEVDFCFGFAFKSNRYTSDLTGVPLLRGDNIINGSLRWDGVARWPADELNEYRTFELQSGDVVLAMDRTWVKSGLKFAVIREEDLPLLQVQRVARMRCRAALLNKFLAFQIERPSFTQYIVAIQTGLGVPHISGKQIGAFTFVMPSLDEQKQIVKRLDAMKALKHALETSYEIKLSALSELKQSLLHKAFAGELT